MHARKEIRKILSVNDLDVATLNAVKEEEDRIRRIKQRNDSRSLNVIASDSYISDDVYIHSSAECSSNPTSSNFNNDCSMSESFEIIIEDENSLPSDDVSVHQVFKPASTNRSQNYDCSKVAHDFLNFPILQKPLELNPSHFNVDSVCGTRIVSDIQINSKITPAGSQFISNSVSLLPHLAKKAKPHQVEGLRFLFDNIIEDINSFNRSNGGFGCILAHSMGLGKTFQSISFVELFLRYTVSTHVLIVTPVNTLHNWKREFDQWLPPPIPDFFNSASASSEGKLYRRFKLFTITEKENNFKKRFSVLTNWRRDAGVLIIGYELFRNLVGLHIDINVNGKRKIKKHNPKSEEVFEILCDPGPDLVICDEGHRIKNDEAALSQAIKCIQTRRRIVLTGFPIQNNLLEYWCMVDFVRPNYLGSKKEFKNLFLRPIENGQCINSLSEDVRLMLQRSHVLHHMLLGIVQRKCEKILDSNIPPKKEYVLFTTLSQYQARLYNVIVNDLREERKTNSSINPLLAFAICCKIWNHPEILFEISNRCETASDLNRSLLDEEKDILQEISCKSYYNLVSDPNVIKQCFEGYQNGMLENGPKFLVLFDIVDGAVSLGEKILIFCQSLSTLNLLEMFLSQSYVPRKTNFIESNTISYTNEHWELGYNYLRLDGSSSSLERDHMITDFNDPLQDKIKLFLISTRAGSLGINLTAASRIIILDISWNPCHDAQAVCRAFRFGQKRECFVYRLIAEGTFESRMYKRQISKISTSERVLDNLKPQRLVSKEDLFTSITHQVEEVVATPNLACFSDEFEDPILKLICRKRQGILTQPPLLHQSLFKDSADDQLNENDKKEANSLFFNERELCRLRETNGRNGVRNDFMPKINKESSTFIDNSISLLKSDSGIETSRYPYSDDCIYNSTSPESHFLSSSPDFNRTSPISISDSDEVTSIIDLDSSSPPSIHSPIFIDLDENDELMCQDSTFKSDSQNDSVIILIDSPRS